ncbi:MAG: TetR family transcriptional regulator [Streptosporangiales bacterium]|nr:TetR family transcriptional regulator [Streptosporangiales bacterium]
MRTLSASTVAAVTGTARRQWGSLRQGQIVDAAVRLARTEGVAALTIRRLADEVGASRMALYRHVPSKDALLDLVANAVAERLAVPDVSVDSPWQDRLRQLAHAMRRELRALPDLAQLIMARGNHSPGGLHLAEAILATLTTADLDDAATARFYLVYVDLVLGRAHRELRGDPTSPSRNEALLAGAEHRPDAPRLRALAPRLRSADPDEVFETELDMFVAAVEHAAQTCESSSDNI